MSWEERLIITSIIAVALWMTFIMITVHGGNAAFMDACKRTHTELECFGLLAAGKK